MTDTLARSNALAPETWDPGAGTVECIAATTAPVGRRDARGPYAEVLDPAGLDLSDAADVPLYDDHRAAGTRSMAGRVDSVRVDGDRIVAVLRLSSADDAAPIRQRVSDGTARFVSAGYRVHEWSDGRHPDGGRVRTAVRWSLDEISITPSPADRACRIRNNGGSEMSETIEQPDPQAEERQRRADIRILVRNAGLGAELGDQLIDDGADMTAAKAAVFDASQRRSRPVIRSHAPANDDPNVIVRRQADALAYRMGGIDELPEEARAFAESSLLDMARDALTRSGQSVCGISRDEILHRSQHGTSDFPLVVSNAASKTSLASYRQAESPLKALCRRQILRDFKTSTAIGLGEIDELAPIAESGEFTGTTRPERGEEIRLGTYGRRIDLSRELILNDDLGLFGDTVAEFGRAAARTEAKLLAGLLTDNPNMRDGAALFASSRGNTESGGTPSQTLLSGIRETMRTRTGPNGAILDIRPAYLVVGADFETDAERLLADLSPCTESDVNPFSGSLRLIVEPRLDASTWFVATAPGQLANLRLAYLAGAEGPQIQRREAWDTLGVSFRCFLDFAVGALDWRGLHRVEAA